MEKDPVCGMLVRPEEAAAKVDYVGQTYYFCSEACHKAFTADPQKYAVSLPHGGGSHYHGNK